MITKEKIEGLILKGRDVLNSVVTLPSGVFAPTTVDNQKFYSWQTQVIQYLSSNIPGENSYVDGFRTHVINNYPSHVKSGLGILQSVLEDVSDLNVVLLKKNAETNGALKSLENLFDRFHLLVRELKRRHDHRHTLEVKDEYDVQDLVRTLLNLYFLDIRPEEYTSSYAGKSARMDFLLKNEKLVVELKMTREGLGGKEIGDQLIQDIERYKNHPDCKTLVCFVYDPDSVIYNPRGLENDLNREDNNLKVTVFVRPF